MPSLQLTCGDALLRPATPDDDDALVAIFPDDADHDPTFERLPGATDMAHRERWLRHTLEVGHATRRPGSWLLPFCVELDGELVGLQWLEGEHLGEGGEVDSNSWLAPAARGRGLGVAMRTAVLWLAFEKLHARRAVSAARPDNIASIRTSERVGYRNLGVREHVVAGRPRPLVHFELTADEWRSTPHPPVELRGNLADLGLG